MNKVDAVCKQLMSFLYTTIYGISTKSDKFKVFEDVIMKEMQKQKDSMLDSIFDTYMKVDNHMNVSNKSSRIMIFNTLKHSFVNECKNNVINLYRKQVLTFLPNTTPTANVGNAILKVINDGNVNRFFG